MLFKYFTLYSISCIFHKKIYESSSLQDGNYSFLSLSVVLLLHFVATKYVTNTERKLFTNRFNLRPIVRPACIVQILFLKKLKMQISLEI